MEIRHDIEDNWSAAITKTRWFDIRKCFFKKYWFDKVPSLNAALEDEVKARNDFLAKINQIRYKFILFKRVYLLDTPTKISASNDQRSGDLIFDKTYTSLKVESLCKRVESELDDLDQWCRSETENLNFKLDLNTNFVVNKFGFWSLRIASISLAIAAAAILLTLIFELRPLLWPYLRVVFQRIGAFFQSIGA